MGEALMIHLGQKLRQTRPTAWMVSQGATGGFFTGMVVDFDARTVTVASTALGREGEEVTIPRRLFAEG